MHQLAAPPEPMLIRAMRIEREVAGQVAQIWGAERAAVEVQRIIAHSEREQRKATEIVNQIFAAQLDSHRERVARAVTARVLGEKVAQSS